MKLIDPKRLAKLMAIQDVSARELARDAGWKSHTYLQRLIRGEVDTLKPAPAARIARRLGVGMDDLFMPRLSSDTGQNARRQTAA